MFKIGIRDPYSYESKFYYATSFEVEPHPWNPNQMSVLLYGRVFPHRKDAAEVVSTDSYITVEEIPC